MSVYGGSVNGIRRRGPWTGLYSGPWIRSVGGSVDQGSVSSGHAPLRQATSGEEFLEYSERQTKTRTGENPRDIRQIKPKMFAVPESERDPVAVYKLCAAKKRPSEMNHDNAPFYLAVNTCKNQDSSKPWFKKSAVG